MRASQVPSLLLGVLGAIAAGGPAWAQSTYDRSDIKLAATSPLATDGRWIYAVADNRRTVLRRTLLQSTWSRYRDLASVRIGGLVAAPDGLYVSDEEHGEVLRVGEGSELERIKPPGLLRPTSMAWLYGSLYVADAWRQCLVQIDLATRKAADVPLPNAGPGPIHLAASARELFVSYPVPEGRSVLLSLASPVGSSPKQMLLPWGSLAETTRLIARAPALSVRKPGVLAFFRGNLYVVDEETSAVLVAYRGRWRAVRAGGFEGLAPSGLLVTPEALLALDGTRGTVLQRPRTVPTEFDLGDDPQAAAEDLLSYLQEIDALPTRAVPWKGSLKSTLQEAGLGFLAPSDRLGALLCRIPRATCARGGAPTAGLAEGTPFPVPDLPAERAIDLLTLRSDQLGDATLGDWVDAHVQDPALRSHASEQRLRDLNSAFPPESVPEAGLRALTADLWKRVKADLTLTLPVERVRLLAALPAGGARGDKALGGIAARRPGFSWVPLEEQEAKQSQASPSCVLPDPPAGGSTLATVKAAHRKMLRTVGFTPLSLPAGAARPVVAVAENDVDPTHVDFDGDTFPPDAESTLTVVAIERVPAEPTPRVVESARPDGDHGTAVAWLIGSHGEAGELEGLAPNVRLLPIPVDDPALGQGIHDAYVDRDARIFNLSLHLKNELPSTARKQINTLQQALFVVAAGNDQTNGMPICDSESPWPAYPVCEGNRKNVIVVAATDLAGTALLVERPGRLGSNWNEAIVHVAAPGEGYFAGSPGARYRPVCGTSFAAPLVTATAALLYAQGVREPWLIKQRIIATADVNDNLRGKVFGAGLLNVTRAASWPHLAVLTPPRRPDVPGDAVPDVLARLEPGSIDIRWETGARRLRLADVRRLTRRGDVFRIVYYDDVTQSIVIKEGVEPTSAEGWPLFYAPIDRATGRPGARKSARLESFQDFVGPVAP